MSKNNSGSDQPDPQQQDPEAPAKGPPKQYAARLQPDLDDNESGSATTTSSPALRLTAWLLAFVILLMILGWALGRGA